MADDISFKNRRRGKARVKTTKPWCGTNRQELFLPKFEKSKRFAAGKTIRTPPMRGAVSQWTLKRSKGAYKRKIRANALRDQVKELNEI